MKVKNKVYSIAVLMSTYNGVNFIREQIESILNQELVDIQLFIRDDGSRDKTTDIIQEYIEKHKNITLFKGENVGVGNSFMNLLYLVGNKFDYYAFADQDDVWLPCKMCKAIDKIHLWTQPILYASNQIIVDEKLNMVGLRYEQKPDISFIQIICRNTIAGCTMLWNNAFQCILMEPKRRPSSLLLKKRMHDVWVAMVASIAGNIIYDTNGYILYRQHKSNFVGVKKRNVIFQWVDKIKHSEYRCGRSHLCKEVIFKFSDLISSEEIYKEIDKFANYKTRFKSKIKLLQDHSIVKYSDETRIGFIIKVLFNLV